MAIDTNLNQLVINKLTKAQYQEAKETNSIVETEIYMITDTEAINADTLEGHPASDFAPAGDYATRSFVTNKIAEAQLGGDSGEIDLSGYATKDELNALSAEDVDALPITGGTINGALNVGGKVGLWTDSEGGNIRLQSPDGKTTDYWEIDSSDGNRLRIFARRNATHPDGEGYVMPLYVYSDGSIGVDNTSKTIERLGAVAATATNLAGMSVKDWAASLTTVGTFYGITNTTTTDMPENLSGSNGYAIVTATVGAAGGWIELRATSILTGYSAVCVYNYGWSEWKSANALASHEYGTTLPAIRPAGSVFYKKV